MTFSFLGPDPLIRQVEEVLRRLAEGEALEDIESTQVDCKEERGRRGPRGTIEPGSTENDEAARHLADELACFANSPGGGAIVLGVADRGQPIGTAINAEWLRHRIYELTNRQLTADVRAVDLDGTRILVLTTHEALEPIRGSKGRVHWRVDDHCVEVDPTTWHAGRLHRSGVDWSAQASGHGIADASAAAIEVARRFLGEAAETGDAAAAELLTATDQDLLRRLNLVANAAGMLTNAGSLLFVATPDDGIDYIRRDSPGDDSTNRARSNRPLLEQVYEVDQAVRTANRVLHAGEGLAKGQIRAIPMRAAREAIVNGVVHRDWLSTQPTTVEHTGDTLTVISPGGFPGGVRPDNIITHPSSPRYRSLAEAVASLRLAEREGVGVDRMVGDMLAVGLPEPEITELPGPAVRVALLGGEPDPQVMRFLSDLDPPRTAKDLDVVLLVDHLTRHGFVDTATAQPVLQRPPGETAAAIDRARAATIDGKPVISPVNGVPAGGRPAYRLSVTARERLPGRVGQLKSGAARNRLILEWARIRGRVSSTEAADLTGLSVVRSGQILTELEERGELAPGKAVKLGRGFFYTPVDH